MLSHNDILKIYSLSCFEPAAQESTLKTSRKLSHFRRDWDLYPGPKEWKVSVLLTCCKQNDNLSTHLKINCVNVFHY